MANRQIQLTEQEANRIRHVEMQSHDVRERQRLQAVRLYGIGMATADIENALNCTQRSIQRWVKRYQEQGVAGLKSRWNGQNAAKLSRQQRADLKQRLHQYTPDQVIAPDSRVSQGQFWTVSDLQIVIAQWYAVTYKAAESYQHLLHECGFSYQRTEKVYRSRSNPQVVADFEAELEKK
jgi:transposase